MDEYELIGMDRTEMIKTMKKITIFCLYWFMNLIRHILLSPFYIIKYTVVFIHYVVDLGFCVNLFNIKQTYKSFEYVIFDIEVSVQEDFYWIMFLILILPGFFFVIPAFIIRHIYFSWVFVKEKYNELNFNER